jgi:hypothetical protein
LYSKTFSGWLRRIAARFIREDSLLLDLNVTDWHTYTLSWQAKQVIFDVDGVNILESRVSPQGPLGMVIWIDNQYAAWRADGTAGMGTLAQKWASWLEIEVLRIEH